MAASTLAQCRAAGGVAGPASRRPAPPTAHPVRCAANPVVPASVDCVRTAHLASPSRRPTHKQQRRFVAAAAAAATPVAGVVGSYTLTQVIAVIIGYCVLAGSCIRSVPQIVKIVRARSVTGLSLAANAAELVAYSITFAYNYRLGYGFSTYGELVSCWAQDLVLVALLLHYGPGLKKRALLGVAAYGGLLWAFMSGAVPMPALTALQASTIFIVALGGRLPQILLNAKRGNSGQLSILTSGLNLAGNVARVFTTLVLTGDGLNLVGAVVQGCLNSVLLTQCWRTIRAGGGATAGGVGGAGGGGELPGLAGA